MQDVFKLLTISLTAYTFLIGMSSQSTIDDLVHLSEIHECSKCPRIYVPVCGTDSKTYINECKMRNCVNAFRNKDDWAKVASIGPCIVFRRSFWYKVPPTYEDFLQPDMKFERKRKRRNLNIFKLYRSSIRV